MASNQRVAIELTAQDKSRAAFESVKRNLKDIQDASRDLGGAFDSLGSRFGIGVGSLAAATAGAGAAIVGLAKNAIQTADGLNDLSLRTGASVEALASVKLAAEQSGTSLEAVGKGLNKLSIWMADNAEKARLLGITAKDPVQAFSQLADVLAGIESPYRRASVANDILGKSYAELLPLLLQGGQGMRDSAAASLDYARAMGELAPKADAFNDRLSVLKQRLDEIGIAAGTLFLDLLPRSFSMDPVAARLGDLKQELNDMERQLRNKSGQGLLHDWVFGSRSDLTARIAATRAEIEKLQAEVDSRSKLKAGAGNGEAELCIANGGRWDGKQCVKDKPARTASAPPKLDTLMTERDRQLRAAELAEYKAIAAAEAEVFDGLLANEDARVAAETESLKNLTALRSEYMNLIDPVQAYREKLEEVQKLLDAGFITQDQAAEMRLRINEMMEQAAGFGEKLKQETSLWEEAWKEAMGNMQDALADFLFDPFDKGLDGMLLGFVNTLRRMAAEALAADIMKSIFGSAGTDQNLLGSIASIFGFADGGVMTSAGPLALKRYAGGGVANSPQLALFGEGATPEAFVPLPDGRNIPVKMQGGGAPQVTVINLFDQRELQRVVAAEQARGRAVTINHVAAASRDRRI